MRVIEMFAGVGGFRHGLSQVPHHPFEFVWANQFEPGTKRQVAWEIYEKNYGAGSCHNADITQVNAELIPDFDLLSAGFPCQDYSVAKSLKFSGGLEGKKGVLWWDIVRVAQAKNPTFMVLENVDRLISSPVRQKGRDFAIILATLRDLNYWVEWRVINAAEYGFPQKRRRTFILAVKKNHALYHDMKKNGFASTVLSEAFPAMPLEEPHRLTLHDTLWLSENFGKSSVKTPFSNSGYLDDEVVTCKVAPHYQGNYATLDSVLCDAAQVPPQFWISSEDQAMWRASKAGMRVQRIDKKTGHSYIYSEGRMSYPDKSDSASRTIITAEGGVSPSRFKHVVEQDGRFRRLTPVELERLNMFPDHHTRHHGNLKVSDTQRAFLMGNALVTGVVQRIGESLAKKTAIA